MNTRGDDTGDVVDEVFGIGTITDDPDRGATFKLCSEFDGETYERFLAAWTRAMAPTNRFTRSLVEQNYLDFVNHQKFVATLLGLGRGFGTPDRRKLTEALMSQIMNWLMAFRLYLDHQETDLKRRFGQNSEQVARFKLRAGTAYDEHVGYRFIYKFRNYVQHCGSPLSSLRLALPEAKLDNPFARQTALFLLNRDDLLARYREWGAVVKEDLRAMDAEFPLGPLAAAAMEQIREVDRVVLEILLEHALSSVADLRESLDRLPADEEGQPALFRLTVGSGDVVRTITPTLLSANAVDQYEQVSDGRLRIQDLYSTPEPPALPSFDPATVRERFRRENRGVQALSLWQAEGGGTPAFRAGITGIVREDGTPEPLITGLINVSASLVHMTATALGVEASGLLGGLLDIYGAQRPGLLEAGDGS